LETWVDQSLVYAFCAPGEESPSSLAMNCRIREADGEPTLTFFTAGKDYALKGALLRADARSFAFQAESGLWQFEYLTLAAFRAWACRQIPNGAMLSQKMTCEDELHNWFRGKYHFPAE